MRVLALSLFLTVAVLLPTTGNAQVYRFRTPSPEVTAAAADWQIRGEPIMVEGVLYYPTRETRFFDGQVMAQVGIYQRVPVYADATLEPYSVLYVPVGRETMRMYERKRDRELAGTTGSRTPSFPVESPATREPREPIVGTPRSIEAGPASAAGTSIAPDRGRAGRSLIESIPRPAATNGVWLEFDGARWYSAGPATSFSPDRFEPVGEYRGFPVYRDKMGKKNGIWVAVVKDGPVAPYEKR